MSRRTLDPFVRLRSLPDAVLAAVAEAAIAELDARRGDTEAEEDATEDDGDAEASLVGLVGS